MTVENGHAMSHLCADGIGYLLVFLGENHKLYTLPPGVHHIVEDEILDDHRTQTEHDFAPHIDDSELGLSQKHGKRTADDEQIDEYEHTPQRNIVIFVDDGGNDIRAPGGAVVQEHHGK